MNNIIKYDRLDKWLWNARLFRSRSLASKSIRQGNFRINGSKTKKASTNVRVGDMLSFGLHGKLMVIKILCIANNRGSSDEAKRLFDDISVKIFK